MHDAILIIGGVQYTICFDGNEWAAQGDDGTEFNGTGNDLEEIKFEIAEEIGADLEEDEFNALLDGAENPED